MFFFVVKFSTVVKKFISVAKKIPYVLEPRFSLWEAEFRKSLTIFNSKADFITIFF